MKPENLTLSDPTVAKDGKAVIVTMKEAEEHKLFMSPHKLVKMFRRKLTHTFPARVALFLKKKYPYLVFVNKDGAPLHGKDDLASKTLNDLRELAVKEPYNFDSKGVAIAKADLLVLMRQQLVQYSFCFLTSPY